jgi:hypothetical protein
MTINAEELAAELVKVQAAKKDLEQRETHVKGLLRGLGLGKHVAGPFTVSIQANNRLDEAKVKEALPITEFPQLWVQKPNTDAIRAAIAPLMYQNLMSPVGDPKVVVK